MKAKVPKPTRRWIKLFCGECIRGSIRTTLTPAQRSVWFDFLLMAGDSRVDGVICATVNVPYPHRHIANTLAISLALLESCLLKFKEQGRITEDGDGIHITKWHQYQAPFQAELWPEDTTKDRKNLILGKTTENAIAIAKGQRPDIPQKNIELYQSELDRMGIPWRD